MSDDWPRYLSKKTVNPGISLTLLICGVLLFLFALILVLLLAGLSLDFALFGAVGMTIGLITLMFAGMELNYWATRYWDKKDSP